MTLKRTKKKTRETILAEAKRLGRVGVATGFLDSKGRPRFTKATSWYSQKFLARALGVDRKTIRKHCVKLGVNTRKIPLPDVPKIGKSMSDEMRRSHLKEYQFPIKYGVGKK